jgi:hypothetical protein
LRLSSITKRGEIEIHLGPMGVGVLFDN